MIGRDEALALAERISAIREELEKLKKMGEGINCIEKNVERMSACVKMLELDISDVAEVL